MYDADTMSLMETATAYPELSEGQQQAVLDTLRSILDSSHFSKSPRSSALLEFAVRNALHGNSGSLKERTVGIEVFGRSADYDTNSDPVVRTAAVEVRRRIVQYFSEHPEAPIRIDLPAGSYRAAIHFRHQAEQQSSHADSHAPILIETGNGYSQLAVPDILRDQDKAPLSRITQEITVRQWNVRTVLGIVALVVVAVASFAAWRYERQSGLRDFWGPVLRNNGQPLILLGRTRSPGGPDNQNGGAVSASNGAVGGSSLALSDAIAAAQISNVFRQFGRDARMEPVQAVGGQEIRNSSFVVVGGLGSPWTQQLLAPLLYHPLSATVLQPDAKGIVLIMEHQPAGDVPLWRFDRNAPTAQFSKDYAIVARFRSEATGGLAIVVAGLGPEGTHAAGYFVSSSNRLRDLLSRAPKGWKGTNFEAVLQVDLVEGTPSNTEVIATNFW